MNKVISKIMAFLIGILIFVVIPILSFGIANFNIYISDIGRLIYLIGMIMLTLFSVIFVPNEGRGSGKGEKTIRSQSIIKLLLQILPLSIIIIAPYSEGRNFFTFKAGAYITNLSLILIFAGNIIMNVAVITLGKQFSIEVTIQKDHKLITSGIYRIIRHPRYAGILILFTGISLLFHSLLGVIITGLLLCIIIWRINNEEQLLETEFNDEWENYKTNTWKIIPYIY